MPIHPLGDMDPATIASPAQALRVFLVEDSPLLRNRLASMVCEEDSLEVAGVASGESEAIHKLTFTSHDVVVVDLQLKPGNGIGVVRAIRAREPQPDEARHVWIVMLTNLNLPAVRKQCEIAGADYFLDKMQEIGQLIPVLLHIARKRQATPPG